MLDFYIMDPLNKLLERKWSVSKLTLRERMGSGNYGQASATQEQLQLQSI